MHTDNLNQKFYQGAMNNLGNLLEEIGWEPELVEEGVFQIEFKDPHFPVSTVLAAIAKDTSQFLLFINFGFKVPSKRRTEVLLEIARVNWSLSIGHFDLDLNDGHLRFKTSVDFEGGELSENLIRNMLLAAIKAIDTYADDFIKVSQQEIG